MSASAFGVEHGETVSKGASYMAGRLIRAGQAGAKAVSRGGALPRNAKADFKFAMKRGQVHPGEEAKLAEQSRVGRRVQRRQDRFS